MRAVALLIALACTSEPIPADRAFGPAVPDLTAGSDATSRHAVTIHVPEGLGRVTFQAPDGAVHQVPCSTCHGPDGLAERAADPARPFHLGLTPLPAGVEPPSGALSRRLEHGQLQCAACHSSGDRDRLRLADGRELPFEDVVTLCAQCHGPQYRDYQRGSHGGMNGYWDLRRGPRTRNSCVDCHHPHAPAYRPVMPVFPPRDRWLDSSTKTETH